MGLRLRVSFVDPSRGREGESEDFGWGSDRKTVFVVIRGGGEGGRGGVGVKEGWGEGGLIGEMVCESEGGGHGRGWAEEEEFVVDVFDEFRFVLETERRGRELQPGSVVEVVERVVVEGLLGRSRGGGSFRDW